MEVPQGHIPKCARCEYDQSGTVATWTDSCPVQGRCTECGLDFLWRDAMNLQYQQQVKFVEHARERVLRAGLRTLVMTWLPWRFWGRLQMHHSLVLGRLWILHLWTSFFSLIFVVLAVGLLLFMSQQWGPTNPLDVLILALHSLFSFDRDGLLRMGMGTPMLGVVFGIIIWFASCTVMPLSMVLLPQTRRMAKLHLGHVVRIALYSIGLIPLLLLVQIVLTFGLHFQLLMLVNISMPMWFFESAGSHGLVIQACIVWWFWACALRRYAKIPHAEGVALSALVLALILGTFMALFTGQIRVV